MPRSDSLNRARYWHDADVAGLGLMHADFARHDFAPHSHDGFVVAVTEAGGSQFTSRGRTGEADPARLLVFNPDEPHAGRMARSRRWRYRAFYLDGEATAAIAAMLGLASLPGFTDNAFADADLIEGFLAAHRALEAGGDRLAAAEPLAASFGLLCRRHGRSGGRVAPAPQDRAMVDRVVAEIEARATENPTLEALGAPVGLTPFQLIGLFKRTCGLTPHAALTQVRLRRAVAAIDAGTPIATAAVEAGFYDQSAFNHHFKRRYGVTPLQVLAPRRRGPVVNFDQSRAAAPG